MGIEILQNLGPPGVRKRQSKSRHAVQHIDPFVRGTFLANGDAKIMTLGAVFLDGDLAWPLWQVILRQGLGGHGRGNGQGGERDTETHWEFPGTMELLFLRRT